MPISTSLERKLIGKSAIIAGGRKLLIRLLFLLILSTLSTKALSYDISGLQPFQCRFKHEDQYSYTSLINLIEAQLKVKVDTRTKCTQSLRQILVDFEAINEVYQTDEFTHEKKLEIQSNVWTDVVLNLEMEKNFLESTGQQDSLEYLTIVGQLKFYETELIGNEIDHRWISYAKDKSLRDELQVKAVNHLNQITNIVSGLSTECIQDLGASSTIMPALLSLGSRVANFATFGGVSAINASLSALSNLSLMFQNGGAKSALRDLQDIKNSQSIACTYQSLKHLSCELSRINKIVEDPKKIIDSINGNFPAGKEGDYQEFFFRKSFLSDYDFIFNSIAEMGAAFTLNEDLITRYIAAKSSRPEDIDLNIPNRVLDNNPNNDPLEAEINGWLSDMENRKINFSRRNRITGGTFSLKEQVQQAFNDIQQKISDIEFTENELEKKRSFIDLRHELISQKPNILDMNFNMILFFTRFANKNDFPHKAPIYGILNFLEVVNEFINLEVSGDYEVYRDEVKKVGAKLFMLMARDTVAQTEQALFALGTNMQKKLNRAFDSIENYFIKEDQLNVDEGSFYRYKIYHALELTIFKNLEAFNGSGRAFRLENGETAMRAIKKGFNKEIYHLLEMDIKSDILSGMEGNTTSHMCALFNDFLIQEDSYKSRKLLRKCKKQYKVLKLNKVIAPHEMEIQYDDSCFYSEFIRTEETQNLFFRKLSNSGDLRNLL